MKISIITTTFNSSATIMDCLESVRVQAEKDVEHIVVDGASTDGTLNILEQQKDIIDKIISEPDKGIYDGMNKGLLVATGEIIGILNADDTYFGSDILTKVARIFESKNVDSCYGDLIYVNGHKSCQSSLGSSQSRCQGTASRDLKITRYWKSGDFDPGKFYWGWMPPHPTFFVRRQVYEKYGYFNLDMGTAADYELMLRFLVRCGISCAYLPEILVRMRSGGASNVSLPGRLRANRMDRKAWELNGLKPYPWTMMLKPLRKLGQWISKPPVLEQAARGIQN